MSRMYTWKSCADAHPGDPRTCVQGLHWTYGERWVGFTPVHETSLWECGECKSVIMYRSLNDHMVWHNEFLRITRLAESAMHGGPLA